MRLRLFCTVSFLFIVLFSFAQRTIKGKIVNAGTGETLAGTSVFINSTSIGTSADRNGNFELNNIPSGRYDLVFSQIGYETQTINFTSEQLPMTVKIEMKVKVKELQNVTVEKFIEESWEKWGRNFLESFIGTVPNSNDCKIRNTKSIKFRFFPNSNRLIAFSDEPLMIENKALGYTIKYQLEDFEINFKEKTVQYAGYPFFEEIEKNGKARQRRWAAAREKAFNGSIMHFFQCVYTNSTEANGYEIRTMRRIPNVEKERVKIAYRAGMITKDSAGKKYLVTVSHPDSSAYYQRILRQNDYTEVYGPILKNIDSLIIAKEGEFKSLYFEDFLYITYKNELEDQAYITFSNENRKPVYQRSYIWLLTGTPVSFSANGSYFPPQELFTMSYWGWNEKIANLLPVDYKPEK